MSDIKLRPPKSLLGSPAKWHGGSCGKLRSFFFFFNDTATTEIYTLSLHDALDLSDQAGRVRGSAEPAGTGCNCEASDDTFRGDRKSTRLNSSHLVISYAVFCL